MFYFLKDGQCSDSTECESVNSYEGRFKGFCNFDNHDSGFCEYCNEFSDGDCELASFHDEKGTQECKRVCEGRFGIWTWNN